MLSRVAENIYWLARYIERAENTARMLRVNTQLVLDTPKGISPGWEPLITISGLDKPFAECCGEANERSVVRFLIGDSSNPGSVLNSLMAARENLRTVREILPRSAWEKINELYLYAKENIQTGVSAKGRDDYLDNIISGSQHIVGLLNSVMYRDLAHHFMRIGRSLERADMTTRIIDVRSTDLLDEPAVESRSLDAIQWISVLKSLSGYQSYRRHKDIRVHRPEALHYLLQDSRFPRSVMYCQAAMEESICLLPNPQKPIKALRAMQLTLKGIDTANISQEALHQVIDKIQLNAMEVHKAIKTTYFHH